MQTGDWINIPAAAQSSPRSDFSSGRLDQPTYADRQSQALKDIENRHLSGMRPNDQGLYPDGQVYNPAAPPGFALSRSGADYNSVMGGVKDRHMTDSNYDYATGETTRKYEGSANDRSKKIIRYRDHFDVIEVIRK